MPHTLIPHKHSKLRFLLLAIPVLLAVFTLARLGFVLYFGWGKANAVRLRAQEPAKG